jgi:hypothetical protein
MVKNYRPASTGMLPAQPGTYLITAYFDDSEVDLVRCNVIGWSISSERTLTPLVVDPRAADDDNWHVLHPDGRVECTDGRCWNDIDGWIADQRCHREARPAAPEKLARAPARPNSASRPPAPLPRPAQSPPPPTTTTTTPVSARPPSAPYAAPAR